MAHYFITSPAALDIEQINEHLESVAGDVVASQVRTDLSKQFLRLAANPGIGHLRTDLTERAVLFFRVHSYLVVYRKGSRGVEILRVLHGAWDVKHLLDE